jgi:hypothetical protein
MIADRPSGAAAWLTTNLPSSNGPQVILNTRWCQAVLDRITDGVHIVDTGQRSDRSRRIRKKRSKRRCSTQEAVDADGPVDAQNAPTSPCKTADGFAQAPTAIIGEETRRAVR